jgi:hypothetical protein
MGNTNCKALVTNYIVTTDPYYKLHYLVTLILFGLLYFYYLKDQEFSEYENRFVVFTSKYILMPLIVNYLVALVFFYIVQLWRRKLIVKATGMCRKKADDMSDNDLRIIRSRAIREVERGSSSRSPRGSPRRSS